MRQVLMHIPGCRRLARSLATGGVVIAAIAGCGESARPAFSDWNERWNEAQLLVPTERQLIDQGPSYCDQLLEQLRTELPALTPAPSESIDPALDAWSDKLRTLAFECPSNPSVIRQELSNLEDLESEIVAVLP